MTDPTTATPEPTEPSDDSGAMAGLPRNSVNPPWMFDDPEDEEPTEPSATPTTWEGAYVLAMIQVRVPPEAANPDDPNATVDAVRAVIGPKPNIFDVGYGAWGQLRTESSDARLAALADPAALVVPEITDAMVVAGAKAYHHWHAWRSFVDGTDTDVAMCSDIITAALAARDGDAS